ncbi:MAG: creatininase family protein [Dehalococcoidia bacterium]|jgi:creatinine amidohydrolase
MKFGDLTYEEIHDCAEKGWLAIVPTGCMEQQGPHLPVDFDTWFAEQVCLTASEKLEKDFGIDSLVLPATPFGPTPEHKNYGSGYIDIPRDLHEPLLACILKSLAEQGFQRIVVWRGCGQHDFIDTVKRFNIDNNGKSAAYLPALPYHDIWCRIADYDIPGGHADSFTTSILLYRRPDSVRRDKIVNPHHTEVDWKDPDLDFAKYSTTGVIGDPTQSSAELGKKLWEAVVKEVSHVFNEIAQGQQSSNPVDSEKLYFLRRNP